MYTYDLEAPQYIGKKYIDTKIDLSIYNKKKNTIVEVIPVAEVIPDAEVIPVAELIPEPKLKLNKKIEFKSKNKINTH